MRLATVMKELPRVQARAGGDHVGRFYDGSRGYVLAVHVPKYQELATQVAVRKYLKARSK